MELPDLKQLARLITLCRKKGVTRVRVGALEMDLSAEEPVRSSRAAKAPQEIDPMPPDDWDNLTLEDKLLYSARPTGPNLEDEPT